MAKNSRFAICAYAVLLGSALILAVSQFSSAQPQSMPLPRGVPVGTMLAYAGEVTGPEREKLWRRGWLPCDGTTLQESQQLPIFEVIDRKWGGDEQREQYKLPDLRGRFVRGVLGLATKEGRDPDVESRVAISKGGATKNNVGSLQGFATAKPTGKNGFEGVTDDGFRDGNPMGEKTGGGSAGTNPANGLGNNVNGAKMHISRHNHNFTITKGGDSETRPVNVYVNWIIKIGPPQSVAAPFAP